MTLEIESVDGLVENSRDPVKWQAVVPSFAGYLLQKDVSESLSSVRFE